MAADRMSCAVPSFSFMQKVLRPTNEYFFFSFHSLIQISLSFLFVLQYQSFGFSLASISILSFLLFVAGASTT